MEMMSPPAIDFDEVLKDSPKFRLGLRQNELSVNMFEIKSAELIKLCGVMIETGKAYMNSYQSFLHGIHKFNDACFKCDPLVYSSFERISVVLEEINKYQKVLIEQAHWSICKNLSDFVKRDISKACETKSHFEKVSSSLDEALCRLAAVPRTKEAEAIECRNELTAVGTCFAHTALDYVFQLNLIQARKRHESIESFLSFILACQTFFHQGHDLFAHWEDSKLELGATVASLKQECKNAEKKMQERHTLVPKEIFQHAAGMPSEPNALMEGYLFKRAKKGFKHWKRRWFVVRDNKILYRKRETDISFSVNAALSRDDDNSAWNAGFSVLEADLRICLVRSALSTVERRNCFELVTPTRIHVFQTDSSSLCDVWIKALQRTIERSLHDTSVLTKFCSYNNSSGKRTNDVSLSHGSREKHSQILDEILSVAGNRHCADCGAVDPRWSSVNLGITLCIACCGIHRSLSVQISKTRSLTMDAWEPEQVHVMKRLGNEVVNKMLLRYKDQLQFPPAAKPESSTLIRTAWIKAKYVERRFVKPIKCSGLRRSPSDVPNNSSSEGGKEPHSVTRLEGKKRRATVVGEDDASFDASLGSGSRKLNPVRSWSLPHANRCLHAKLSSGLEGRSCRLNSVHDVDQLTDVAAANAQLFAAAEAGDVVSLAHCLIQGASVEAVDLLQQGQSALHKAVKAGSVDACEYLLLNRAPLNGQDLLGQTPLHFAVQQRHTALVCQLLKKGANHQLRNKDGLVALDLAENGESQKINADIVVLLRLATLNQSIRDGDEIEERDETLDQMIKEFSRMDPKALTRSDDSTNAGV